MRVLIIGLSLTLAALQFRLWFSDDGLRELWNLQAELDRQSERNAAWADRNTSLAAEVADLKQGEDAAEERARSDLGLVRSDETFYQIIDFDESD